MLGEEGEGQNLIELETERFIQELADRQLPIDPHDAKGFARLVSSNGPPEGFLQRLTQGMQYVSRETFDIDFNEFSHSTQEIIKDEPYSVIFNGAQGSGKWIYEELVKKGLPLATHSFCLNEDDDITVRDQGFQRISELLSTLSASDRILIPDDFSLSGSQIEELLANIPDEFKNVCVNLMYATDDAINWIGDRPQITRTRKVDELGKFLETADADFINILLEKINPGQEYFARNVPFFWTWYKVPDNIQYALFTDESHSPLLKVDNYKQPYREPSGEE